MSDAEADSLTAIFGQRCLKRYKKHVVTPLVKELRKRSKEDLMALVRAGDRREAAGMTKGVEAYAYSTVAGMAMVILKVEHGWGFDEVTAAG